MNRLFFAIGSLMAAISVAAGAYGAHGGESLNADQVRLIAKAARYQMYHGIALILTAQAMYNNLPSMTKLLQAAGYCFLMGIFLFSGSLYLMSFLQIDLGYLTPAGGISFLLGWCLMAFAALKK